MRAFQSILLITNDALSDVKKHLDIDVTHPDIDTLVLAPDPTIGIESIRQLQLFASRRPLIKSTKQIVIKDAHLLTNEAQNAFLKLLEEPPAYLEIILTAPYTHTFLETILSRCEIIKSRSAEILSLSKDEVGPNILAQLLSLSPPARLGAIPPDTKVRITAISYCQQLISEAEKIIHMTPTITSTNNLEILTNCLTHITANSNPTLALTDAILRLQV